MQNIEVSVMVMNGEFAVDVKLGGDYVYRKFDTEEAAIREIPAMKEILSRRLEAKQRILDSLS